MDDWRPGCTGKKAHLTRDSAKRTLDGQKRFGKDRGDFGDNYLVLNIYRCRYCQHWHIGRMGKAVKSNNKGARYD